MSKLPPGAWPKLTEAVKKRIVGVKRAHPEYGPRRIAAALKRFFLVSASATSVHKTLSGEGLTKKAKSKPVMNPAKPRFFERSRPNQLWQSFHHDLSAGSAKCLPDRLFRRLLALHHQPWSIPQPDRRACVGDLPAGGGRIRCAARDAYRQRPAVHQLARKDPLRAGDEKRPGQAHPIAPPPPHDAHVRSSVSGKASKASFFFARSSTASSRQWKEPSTG